MIILGNRILVQPTAPIDKLPSGLFLPETALQKPNTGKVVCTGTKADSNLMDKTILYNPLTAIVIEEKHLIHVLDIRFIL